MHMLFLTQKQKTSSRGFTLLFAMLIAAIVLAVGLAALNIALKELQLSKIASESEKAFYAADAGTECILYQDYSQGELGIGANTSITCMGDSENVSISDGDVEEFEFSWETSSGENRCAKITFTKTLNGSTTDTDVISDGYNRACSDTDLTGTVERSIETSY